MRKDFKSENEYLVKYYCYQPGDLKQITGLQLLHFAKWAYLSVMAVTGVKLRDYQKTLCSLQSIISSNPLLKV